jgi:L,D-transpeptidase YcbB
MWRRFLVPWLLAAVALPAGALAADASLWFERGRPIADAREAVQVLLDARAEGLDPADYGAPALAAAFDAAQRVPLADGAQAQLDQALTAAVQRYVADLQHGRVDPRTVHADFPPPHRPLPDTIALLRAGVAAHRVAQVLHEAEPRLPMYASLRAALAQYRALGEHPAWQSPLPPLPVPARKVTRGQFHAGLGVLAQRLAALGDLPAGSTVPARYDDPLVTAVEAFQERHGLTPDGVLGPATLQQLNVTPAQRARQIELAMERLRWTPFMQGPRMVVINIPEFVLRAYEVQDGRIAVRLAMKVIVGNALRTRTPLLGQDMRFIEFSPFWNVPPSIAGNETIPRLRRDPGYLAREGLEFVGPGGQVATAVSAAALEGVQHGGWRIRQRPGSRNALGGIKFVFPNDENIYLHDTPTRQLFERDRRDFSHGCIRLEAPLALARFVLQDEPGWTDERIREAMDKGVSTTLRLKQPLPVLIAYSTVIVKSGTVFFFPDLYGQDAVLDRALRQRVSGFSPAGAPRP